MHTLTKPRPSHRLPAVVLIAACLMGASFLALAQVPAKAVNAPVPVISGGLPVVPGTAWKIDWGIKSANKQVFLFCSTGRWEVVSPMLSSGAVTLMGRYTIQGNSLVTKNMKGGETTTYRSSWKAGVWELDSGKSVMRLHYNGPTACK